MTVTVARGVRAWLVQRSAPLLLAVGAMSARASSACVTPSGRSTFSVRACRISAREGRTASGCRSITGTLTHEGVEVRGAGRFPGDRDPDAGHLAQRGRDDRVAQGREGMNRRRVGSREGQRPRILGSNFRDYDSRISWSVLP
jgi:hypothetical protein